MALFPQADGILAANFMGVPLPEGETDGLGGMMTATGTPNGVALRSSPSMA
jgi:hypothetical protein